MWDGTQQEDTERKGEQQEGSQTLSGEPEHEPQHESDPSPAAKTIADMFDEGGAY